MRWLLLLAVAACSGRAGAREHAEATAVATHCDRHGCATPTDALNLGEGCYAVDDHLYQCASDGPNPVSCFEIPSCAELCEITVTDRRGLEVSIDRCQRLWGDYRAANQPPPTCEPVRVQVGTGDAHDVEVGYDVIIEVVRSGKSKVVYEAEVCADGVTPTRTSGFAALDDVLRADAATLAPADGCVSVALIGSNFECS